MDTKEDNSGEKGLLKGFPEEAIIKVKQINPYILGEMIYNLGKGKASSNLSEFEQTKVKFLKAAIHSISQVLDDGADLENAVFIVALPGLQFALKSGAGDWEYYFSQDDNNKIIRKCTRKPWVYYVWDGIKFTYTIIPQILSTLLSILIAVQNLMNACGDTQGKNK